MKYIWEKEDIVAGLRLKHFSGTVYTIVTVDTHEQKDAGWALLNGHRVTPTYTVEKMVEQFNGQGCVPLFL